MWTLRGGGGVLGHWGPQPRWRQRAHVQSGSGGWSRPQSRAAPQPSLPCPQGEIFQAFTELFQVACAKPPPLGLCDYASSRAVYAIDLMLKWEDRPDGEGTPCPVIPTMPSPLSQSRSSSPASLPLSPPHPGRCSSGCPWPHVCREVWSGRCTMQG